jgi:hypothetical protein
LRAVGAVPDAVSMRRTTHPITGVVCAVLVTSCSGSSSGAVAIKSCKSAFPTVTASGQSSAGDLRHFGLRGKAPGHFAGLPDDEPVTLCAVPDPSGKYTVYGVPKDGNRSELLWLQDDGRQITRPAY